MSTGKVTRQKTITANYDLTRLQNFLSYWEKWLDGNMSTLSAQEYIAGVKIITAATRFYDVIMDGEDPDDDNNN